MQQIIDKPNPRVGLIIGTFAAVPYVHLALESWRRNCCDMPVLVHDDNSDSTDDLKALCHDYGVEFSTNDERSGWIGGDLSTYVRGLSWATERELDLLVKMSRRFIPLYSWLPGFRRLAYETQYATYSNQCLHFNFGFRTECIGFHVQSWVESQATNVLREQILRKEPILVEAYMHKLAQIVHATNCDANREYEVGHPRPPAYGAYGVWDIMETMRTSRRTDVLWHDADSPFDYWGTARFVYDLPYTLQDFADPDHGQASKWV